MFFFFNDTATTEIYTLSLHDALPIFMPRATAMMGVPTFYVRLLQHPGLARDATSGMRLFVSGSAPLLAETHREWSAHRSRHPGALRHDRDEHEHVQSL